MPVLRRLVDLIVQPKREWAKIAREKTTIDALLRSYILPLALLTPMATAYGMMNFDRNWHDSYGYLVPHEQVFMTAATTYFAIVGSIFALAGIFTAIVPMFGARRDYRAALRVATYGAVPTMLAGATMVLPILSIVGLAGLIHSMYLYWLGAKQVLGVPASSGAEFVGISVVLFTVVSVLAGAAASSIGML